MKGVKAKKGGMRETEFLLLVRGSGTSLTPMRSTPCPGDSDRWVTHPSQPKTSGYMTIGSDIDVLVVASRTEMLREALVAAFKIPRSLRSCQLKSGSGHHNLKGVRQGLPEVQNNTA